MVSRGTSKASGEVVIEAETVPVEEPVVGDVGVDASNKAAGAEVWIDSERQGAVKG